MELSNKPLVIRGRDAAPFMKGDEFFRHYVSTGTITFGTSSLQPGQHGAVDTGHPDSHEVFFCIRGHVLIYTEVKECDVTGRPVVTTENEEAACLGPAILAGSAVGMFASLDKRRRLDGGEGSASA